MVIVKLFAAMAEEAGVDTIELPWQDGLTTQSVKELLAERYAPLTNRLEAAMVAVNQAFVPGERELHDHDEVAFIPPVSGG
ncbi:molybdopterin converting factor subunit 1 [Aneurinibacillus tyrosinisolvens]|uniref:molybdopterin converting factor subunit 1 n=1 Tax=Aneurinibacillus tyrosinisolvens TaxID=1443435 RepID=UPI00063F11C1|nr:molybdopterin converting factor subunit 1 [Aneurinibacillus tyrosinisolvens]